jgi:hypothetical protein
MFSDEVNTKYFFRQLEELFYPKPKITNRLEDSRNKFFEQALSYQSNAFHFLKFCSFFIQLINIKYIEICLTQKPIDIIQILSLSDHGFDFWGDKSDAVRKVDEKERVPLGIVEKMVDIQKNYLNLRINFDTFRVDMEEVMKSLKLFLNDKDKLMGYMDQLLNWKLYHWYYLFNSSREFCIKNNDIPSFNFLTKIIMNNFFYGKNDYFKKSDCRFNCHIHKKMSNDEVLELFKKHMHYENSSYPLDKLYENNYYSDVVFQTVLIGASEECPVSGDNKCVYRCNPGSDLDVTSTSCHQKCKLPWDSNVEVRHGYFTGAYNTISAFCAEDDDNKSIDTCAKHRHNIVCDNGDWFLADKN